MREHASIGSLWLLMRAPTDGGPADCFELSFAVVLVLDNDILDNYQPDLIYDVF
jgi:hypothetical protein